MTPRLFFPFLALLLTTLFQTARAEAPGTLEPLLREEIGRLQAHLEDQMSIVLFRMDDPLLRSYIAGGILRLSAADQLNLRTGLAAVMVFNGKHNGENRPVCYILFHPEYAKTPERAFFAPIGAVAGDPRQGAAWLAAHEVGHCLDQNERQQRIGRSMKWTASEAWQVGLQPDAFERSFGPTAATAAYPAQLNVLANDLAQQQAQERVADSFAVLWVWRLGGAEGVRQAVLEVRLRDKPSNAHATAPALEYLPAMREELDKSQDIRAVWALARRAQQAAGVDPALAAGSTIARQPATPVHEEPSSLAPTAQPPRSKAWNELPRFGAPQGR